LIARHRDIISEIDIDRTIDDALSGDIQLVESNSCSACRRSCDLDIDLTVVLESTGNIEDAWSKSRRHGSFAGEIIAGKIQCTGSADRAVVGQCPVFGHGEGNTLIHYHLSAGFDHGLAYFSIRCYSHRVTVENGGFVQIAVSGALDGDGVGCP